MLSFGLAFGSSKIWVNWGVTPLSTASHGLAGRASLPRHRSFRLTSSSNLKFSAAQRPFTTNLNNSWKTGIAHIYLRLCLARHVLWGSTILLGTTFLLWNLSGSNSVDSQYVSCNREIEAVANRIMDADVNPVFLTLRTRLECEIVRNGQSDSSYLVRAMDRFFSFFVTFIGENWWKWCQNAHWNPGPFLLERML
jgi:hypothetical protein